MDDALMKLRQRVYGRSLSKSIGVVEAIDELLAEVTEAEDARRLADLRGALIAWRAWWGLPRLGSRELDVEAREANSNQLSYSSSFFQCTTYSYLLWPFIAPARLSRAPFRW
jgi:hypothetical protein